MLYIFILVFLVALLVIVCIWCIVASDNSREGIKTELRQVQNKLNKLDEDIQKIDETQINIKVYLSELIQRLDE